ncbi:MAG: succinate dehydrogenase assembly factor 2 [Gammaproteobacteria bacterium]|nr:succinate dehydrogenase assembly factor 2 [Gammaproteobacteria bacterium]
MTESGDSQEARALDARRVWWRSRRGLRELDLLLLPFVEDVYPSLGPEQRAIYLRLLDNEDPELLVWFTGRGVPLDAELSAMIEFIRSHGRPVS